MSKGLRVRVVFGKEQPQEMSTTIDDALHAALCLLCQAANVPAAYLENEIVITIKPKQVGSTSGV